MFIILLLSIWEQIIGITCRIVKNINPTWQVSFSLTLSLSLSVHFCLYISLSLSVSPHTSFLNPNLSSLSVITDFCFKYLCNSFYLPIPLNLGSLLFCLSVSLSLSLSVSLSLCLSLPLSLTFSPIFWPFYRPSIYFLVLSFLPTPLSRNFSFSPLPFSLSLSVCRSPFVSVPSSLSFSLASPLLSSHTLSSPLCLSPSLSLHPIAR